MANCLAQLGTVSVRGPLLELRRPDASAVVEVLGTDALRSATLHWRQVEPLLRREIEAALGPVLVAIPATTNPVSGWLALTSVLFGVFALFSLALRVVVLFMQGR